MSPAMVMSEQNRIPINYDNKEINYQKGVKHLHENGIEHVPKKYIFPLSERSNATISEKSTAALNLPIIDFAEFRGPNRSKAIKSLGDACKNYGFFQLVNHGIPEEILQGTVNASTRFFEMPISEREKYMTSDIRSPVRYGTSFNQTNDGVFCWRDFLKLVCHPLPEVLPLWPSSPTDFSEMAVTYAKETKLLFLMLVEAILESLGVKNMENKTETVGKNDCCDEIESILDEFENGSQLMIMNCYPLCPEPDLTLGMPPHSDYGFLTLLLQDDVKGLQIQHQQNWVTIQPIPGSFVVNVGDHLEIFSNGRYKSVLHRVLVNSMKNRISVASLHSIPFANTVRPCSMLVNETNPRRYKDTDFANFLEYITSCDSKQKNFLESRKLETS